MTRPSISRRYRKDTLILETSFETADGAVTLIDFMPIRGRNPDCVRIVVGERGRVPMCAEVIWRFGYGAIVPWVRKLGDGALRAIAGPDMVVLRTPVHLRGENLTTVGEFVVSEGDRVPFVMSYGPSHLPVPEAFSADAALQDTESFWREWCHKGQVHGPWKEAVTRSLITLKALTYGPTGGLVAAPTTSLPEFIGGNRNWDYRYCWLRDATLTLLALMNAGYFDEAQRWRDWLTRAVAGKPEQLARDVWRGRRAASHRMGGGLAARLRAVTARSASATRRTTSFSSTSSARSWIPCTRAGAADCPQTKPAGTCRSRCSIISPRSGATPTMASGKCARSRCTSPIPRRCAGWHSTARSRAPRCSACPARRTHGESCVTRSTTMSAATAGTRSATPSRARTAHAISMRACCCSHRSASSSRTIRAIAAPSRRSSASCSSTASCCATTRSKSKDGLPPGEGAFLACSFWLADAYLLLGRRDDAERLFRRLIGLCNDVGLLAEEYDPRAKRQLGNFPQAFSHVALINTAFNLTRAEKPAEQRADLPKGTAKSAEAALCVSPALRSWHLSRPRTASPTLSRTDRPNSDPEKQQGGDDARTAERS